MVMDQQNNIGDNCNKSIKMQRLSTSSCTVSEKYCTAVLCTVKKCTQINVVFSIQFILIVK